MRYFATLIGMMLLAACSLQPIETGTNTSETIITSDAPTLQMLCEQKGYTWHEDGTCRYDQDGTTTQPTLHIHYPIELIQSPLIESTLDQYLAEYRASFMSQFEQDYDPTFATWFLELGFTIYRHSPSIVSVQYSESFYTGGAHPGLWFSSFTFDTAHNRILQFADLFVDGVDPVAIIAPLALAGVQANLPGYPSEEIRAGMDELHEFDNFALSDSSLFIFFPPYQVAAYAAGPQLVEIPLRDLVAVLRDL